MFLQNFAYDYNIHYNGPSSFNIECFDVFFYSFPLALPPLPTNLMDKE